MRPNIVFDSLLCSAADAVACVKSGQRVFVQGAAATPTVLLQALVQRHEELHDVEIVHLHLEGDAPHFAPGMEESFRVNNLFIGANAREAVQAGLADYTPVFLSEVPRLFRSGRMPIDVAFVHVSPPDDHGICSLGVSVDTALAAAQCARTVVAQVNPQMPRTHGDGFIHFSDIDHLVEVDRPICVREPAEMGSIEQHIGEQVASLIEDGSTLQMGIGTIPDAVLHSLQRHRDLGVHTEMFSDGVVDLVENGVINGRHKKIMPGKIVSGFVFGSRRVYDFINDNATVVLLDIGFVNDTAIIRQNPRVVAINSAIEVDVTGQVVADSIGSRFFSGIGGQMDFMRGAALSEGGKAIIALPSRTRKGVSRIVPHIRPGAGVVTTRGHIQYVVTEYGIAELYGRSIRERVEALVGVAHPDDRVELMHRVEELKWV